MNRYEKRLQLVRKDLPPDSVMFLNSVSDVRYLTGFTGDSSLCLISHKSVYFLTDGRYTLQIAQEAQIPLEICEITPLRNWKDILRELVLDLRPSKFLLDKSSVTLDMADKIRSALKNTSCRIKHSDTLRNLRMIKDEVEIETIRQNLMITEAGYSYIIRQTLPGRTENQIAAELEYYLRRQGAFKLAFDTIIASGYRSALPHGTASDKKLIDNEIVLFDFGIVKDGYCSDFTRAYYSGKIIDSKIKEIHAIVLEALQNAQAKIKPGVTADEVHRAAYQVIESAGYGKYFTHSTGHGVGLNIHEAPWIKQGSRQVLREGMVFTIEPGIYLPGKGGIRLEDIVVVRTNGFERLTSYDYDL